MKLQVSMGQSDLAGYTNIDVLKSPIDLGKLDDVCEEAECTHIILNNVLKFIPYQQIPIVLQHIGSRLRHKGKITLMFHDLNNIVRSYNVAELDETKLNSTMFGQGYRSCFSHNYITHIIQTLKLDIVSININKTQTIINIERP